MATNMATSKGMEIKRPSIYFSLRWKLLIGFTLIFSVVFAIAFYWFYQFATDAALQRIQDDLTSTLQGGAANVNTDELVALAREGQPNADGFTDDPRYQKQLDWLDTVHKIEPRAWPYIYIPGNQEGQIFYVVDLFARYDPSRSTAFMEPYQSKGSALQGLKDLTLRTTNGRFDTYTDKWGRWVSAYTPIKDKNGKIIGAMGIDFIADYVDQVRQSIIDRVALAFLLTYTSLFLLVFLFSGALTGPIVKLTQAANALGEGDYSQDFSKLNRVGRFSDEIEKLAAVFTVMADKVRHREQTLRKQVEALKIEIDETKRKKQVSEIADSDFFRELQNKARDMRSLHGDE
jgi:HAMP domain-containing protein